MRGVYDKRKFCLTHRALKFGLEEAISKARGYRAQIPKWEEDKILQVSHSTVVSMKIDVSALGSTFPPDEASCLANAVTEHKW